MWRNDATRNAKAAGAAYVLKMIDKIEFQNNDIPRLVDQTKADDYSSAEFMKHMVTLAHNCGRQFKDDEPAADNKVKKNYYRVELDLQSFGAQISAAAPVDRKDIFNQEDLMECPFAPILEWHALYRSFDPHRGKDPTKYRDALNAALAEEIDLSSQWISGWMSRISNARTDLIKIEPKDAVDATIIGPVINKFVEITDSSRESIKWQIKADRWHGKYIDDNKSVTWMFLKQSILETADTVKKRSAESTTMEETRQPRPKLNPSLPAAVALSAVEKQEIYDEAYHAALSAFQATEQARRDSRQCYNCGRIGHTQHTCRDRPQSGHMAPRVSRWERVGGLRGGGNSFGRGGYSMPPGRGYDAGSMDTGSGGSRGMDTGPGGGRGSTGPGGGRGMGGGGGTGRGVSADPGFAGRGFQGRGAFGGRGVPSRPLSAIVGQQAGLYGADDYDLPEFEAFDHAALHTHVPGAEHDDRDAQLREQVFGAGHHFGQPQTTNTPQWTDPMEGDTTININNDPADPLPPNLTPPSRTFDSNLASRALNLFTCLPIALEMALSTARRCLPTHLPRTPCATFGLIITVLLILTFLPSAQTAFIGQQREVALPTFGLNSSTLDSYLLDSGCTTSIIADTRFLSDFKRIPTVSVSGLAGNKQYNWTATLTLPVKTIHGDAHQLHIENVYWDETGTLNLISGHQVEADYKIILDGDDSALHQRPRPHLVASQHPVKLPVAKIGRLYLLPIFWHGATPPASQWQSALAPTPVQCSFNANCGSMSLEELFHLRMAHTPIPKLAKMSRMVKGTPRCLQFTKLLRFPCGICQEAKAKRQPFPAQSTNVSTREDDLMTWDSFDMGDAHKSLGRRVVVPPLRLPSNHLQGTGPRRAPQAAPRGEQGVFLGLGMTHGYKSWVVYSPRLNRVFVSRNVTFDETLFPMRQNDQRVLGFYDNHSVHEMRADAYGTTHPIGISEDVLNMPLPKDPVVSSFTLPTKPAADSPDALSQAETVSSQVADEEWAQEFHWSETPTSDLTPPSGGSDHTQASGGNSTPPSGGSAGGAPAGELRHVKRQRFCEAPPAYGQPPQKWWDCENSPITSVSDSALAEFLIGHSINITFPADFWPRDRGQWAGEAFDTGTDKRNFGGRACLRFLLTSGPKSRRFGEHAIIPISHVADPANPNATNVSVRRALAEDFPHASLCKDLTIDRHGKQSGDGRPTIVEKRITRSRARAAERAAAATEERQPYIIPAPSSSAKLLHSPEKCKLPALYAFAATTMLQSQQYEHNYVSELQHVEPKNEREARESPFAQDWLTAEEIEIKTIWKMDTFEITDLPPGIIPLPSRFTYKIKRDKLGAIAKLKARLVARGDMQTEDEYSTTFAPTSRFTAIRTIISIATQENLSLKHWDITGAFMTSEIDTDIYMDLPPGYHLPPGKTIKLKKSLYGLRQSPGLFHDTLEQWLRNYGFRAIDDDGTIFKLTRGRETVLLSLFVDDGLCATNSQALYDDFLRDLKGKFELSDQGDLSWYLGVDINHNLGKGVTTLNQTQFIDTMLKRFNMDGCNPISTPAEPNAHLLKADQPSVPDKRFTRDYQRLVGGLMYLSSFTRPDISYAVNQCAKFMANPGPTHLTAAKRILRYLAGTRHLGITYRRSRDPGESNRIIAYADSDHAGDPDSRRSVTGYLLLLNGGAVSWQSVRQQVVALSSAEAEYYAASVAGTDITYLRRLMEELGYPQARPTVVYEDNMACIFMSRSSGAYHKVRHIDTRVYHLRDLCKDGTMELEKVDSARQAADSLTKGTPRALFEDHRRVMLGLSSHE
eukprot:CAMPEP_0181339602 /NCGR_PEP_ID=MMETSP1101-20121128/29358_1 /TAXON_ID=46948 /ORGANISM="Rhodomonas abbreviata, Strain Caron Lab Isolate" /LENGTH=1796 /DNA_ID=CAMNT_0023450611 /DNA_START=148 /DNA_END=5539 /DNA_ORIENTATION=+